MTFGREIPKIADLMKLEVATNAKLLEVEVIAVVLYTGPMVRRPLAPRQPWLCSLALCPAQPLLCARYPDIMAWDVIAPAQPNARACVP